ncbi:MULTISPECIES: hypothetical protein [unclassified Roseibium]|uniref:hypothetical protein n=1 Tax=unclassified Roseibium TaxID=2629323 RepID=UPI00273E60D9|nr:MULTISPECIES: hypothetical protein [unclassified Roseibium]
MITFRKRVLPLSTPIIVAGTLFTSALAATEYLYEDEGVDKNPATIAAEVQDTFSSGKGDLKISLDDVHKRPVRCVSNMQQTTCTGWPLANGMIALNSE